MNKIVLIDTSVWIFALRKKFIPQIKSIVEQYLIDDIAAITPIVKLELVGGARTDEEFERLKMRLSALHQLKITEQVWEKAEEIAFSLYQKSLKVPYTDILISSVALLSNVILVHADSHFELIAKNFKLQTKSLIHVINQ